MRLKSIPLRAYYETKRTLAFFKILMDLQSVVRFGLFTPVLTLYDGTQLEVPYSYYDYLVLWENFCKREYEKYIPANLKPAVILDIGAHKGFFTNAIARRFPEAKVYAIEPSSENFSFLIRNTSHLPNVVCINAAVWKESGVMELRTDSSNSVSHSLVPRTGADGTETVQTITMADLPLADLIKVDIEGAEHHLAFDAKYLALEVHEDEDLDFDSYVSKLKSQGYRNVIVEKPIVYAMK